MNRIGQIAVTAAVFIGVTIGIDFLIAFLLADSVVALNSLAVFPGQSSQATYLDRYIGFLTMDTLGWFTYVTLGASQNMEILASTVGVGGNLIFYGLPSGATGLIPVLLEYHFASSAPQYALPALSWLLKLVVPLLVTGIVAGSIAKEKKGAMLNAFVGILVVGVIAMVLNIVHVSLNFELSFGWKFTATITQNPMLYTLWLMELLTGSPDMINYLIWTSSTIVIFALINGLIFSIVAAAAAMKK
jgi:hypothetical protein